jgi:hypothetical protein
VITGFSPSRPAEDAKPANEVITGFLPEVRLPEQVGKRPCGASEAYRELIERELSRGRNAMGIWQDLVDQHGYTSSYQSIQRFVLKLRGAASCEARVIIETRPGEESQVDYENGPMVRDPDSGKYRRTRLFVMTLGCSRKRVRLLTFRSSARVWAELHEKAFRRLGGSPRVMVLDNLREGVLSPDFYDPGVNPLYRDVLAQNQLALLAPHRGPTWPSWPRSTSSPCRLPNGPEVLGSERLTGTRSTGSPRTGRWWPSRLRCLRFVFGFWPPYSRLKHDAHQLTVYFLPKRIFPKDGSALYSPRSK